MNNCVNWVVIGSIEWRMLLAAGWVMLISQVPAEATSLKH
jgi:hypothetical protein